MHTHTHVYIYISNNIIYIYIIYIYSYRTFNNVSLEADGRSNGNGRTMRNLLESSFRHMALRVLKLVGMGFGGFCKGTRRVPQGKYHKTFRGLGFPKGPCAYVDTLALKYLHRDSLKAQKHRTLVFYELLKPLLRVLWLRGVFRP